MRIQLTKETLRSYASAAEQSAISVTNLATSFFVLSTGSVYTFGIYSLLFSLTILINGLCSTLIHRQMVLHISPLENQEKNACFKSSALHQTALIALLSLITLAGFIGFFLYSPASKAAITPSTIIVYLAYLLLYNFFDLFRQFLYSNDSQIKSLCTTSVFALLVLAQLGFIVIADFEVTNSIFTVFCILSIGVTSSFIVNRFCFNALVAQPWPTKNETTSLFKHYFQQGRFGSLGATISWMQSHAVSFILALVYGPLIVGYFNIGRLMVMPLATINRGLGNSSLPRLRRLFVKSGARDLQAEIRKFALLNLKLSFAYSAILLILIQTNVLTNLIPSYSMALPYIAFWLGLMSAITIRFWVSQHFAVTMQLKKLLQANILSVVISVTGLILSGMLFNSILIGIGFIIIGEISALLYLLRSILNSIELKN